MHCRLVIVPDQHVPMVPEKLGYTEVELHKIEKLRKARGGKSFKNGRDAIACIKSL